MPSWTTMQQAAIDQRNADILVSAAAGSGKTAVLTERVMQRLIGSEKEAPIELDRFLIVTFTSAAAQEMKERIMQKVTSFMDELTEKEDADPAMLDYLERQIALVPQASISTIHAFCLKVIRNFFNELDIDPNIKVGNDGELAMLRSELLDDLMEEYLEAEDPDFLELADVYGSVQGLDGLKELILDVDTFSKSTPFPKLWLKRQVENLKRPYATIDEMPWAAQFKEQIEKTVADVDKLYDKAIALCRKPNGPELYEEAVQSDRDQLSTILEAGSLKDMILAVMNMEFIALSRKKQECDMAVKEQVKKYRDLAKDVIKKLQEDLSYVVDEKLLMQLPFVGHLMESLCKVIEAFEERYSIQKQEMGVADYNDLEHYALELLVKPAFDEQGELIGVTYTEAAKELSRFYKEVYIDEYQDSNTVQETLLKAVAEADQENGPTRFMVGDMKQSIYRFRLANPKIFAEKYQAWEKHEGTKMTEAKEVCIDLSQNFRSRANILEGANDLFEQVMSEEVGELAYDAHAKLYVGNFYNEGNPEALEEGSLSDAIELHLLETKEQEESTEDESGLDNLKNAECEAMLVAGLIDQLLRGEGNPTHIFDKEIGAYRKVEPRDIVILLRATKDKANIFENALISKGIGAYADMSNSFFDAMEVQTMISLLKIIDNPLQDIPLLTVLRSPIVGANYDELVYIRKAKEDCCFFDALTFYCESHPEKIYLNDFLDRLEAYREISSELKTEELIARLYIETGYYRYVTMLPTGPKKKANLELLRKYAADYETNNQGKLFGFLQYLDKLSETKEGLQEAKVVDGNENLVRIMSIHKSKGLEFSVVFLSDSGKRFNNNDLMKQVLLHNELGLAPDYVDTKHYVKYPTLAKLAIKEQIKSENISEEMRVLYVALTRAKEKLFITGTLPDLQDRIYLWRLYADRTETAIMPLGVKRGNSYLNWIGMSLYAHPNVPFFREMIGDTNQYDLAGNSRWQVKVWHKEDLGELEKVRQALVSDQKQLILQWDSEAVYSEYKEDIIRQLSYVYPYEKAISLPGKVSVSELKRQEYEELASTYVLPNPVVISDETEEKATLLEEAYIPKFMRGEEVIKGAVRGTLIHSVFEHLDYLRFTKESEIKAELERLIGEHILQQEILEAINIKRLSEMAQSKIVDRMRKAKHVEKEKAFIYLMAANQVNPDYPENEEILVQGVIDSFFVDEEGITLIDYKTDYIDRADVEKSKAFIISKYKKQLELYAVALENITKTKVAHRYIYLYNINEWVRV